MKMQQQSIHLKFLSQTSYTLLPMMQPPLISPFLKYFILSPAFSSLFFIIHSYYFVLISHQPVLSFPLQRLQLRDGEANPISLATATLTPKAGNTVWTLSKSSGFLPYAYPLPSPLSSQPCSMLCLLLLNKRRTNVTLSFNNIPASVCASPVSPVGGTATTVV